MEEIKMAEQVKKPLKITETVLRDAHHCYKNDNRADVANY